MFKKVLYVVFILIVGQFVLSFNIATIRSEKRVELEEKALTSEPKDFKHILENLNGKYIAAEEAYYNLEPVYKYENEETLSIYFFELYSELVYNKEDLKDKVLYVVITDINEKYTKEEATEDKSTIELKFSGEKQIETPYAINILTYKQSYYELIFSLEKLEEEKYGTAITDIIVKGATEQEIFKLSTVNTEGIDIASFKGETLKAEHETNENYGKCLSRNEHYEKLEYKDQIGRIIKNEAIFAVIALGIGFLWFRPRKKHSRSSYSNYKPANYRTSYAENIKKKVPSQVAFENEQKEKENTENKEIVENTEN